MEKKMNFKKNVIFSLTVLGILANVPNNSWGVETLEQFNQKRNDEIKVIIDLNKELRKILKLEKKILI
jgi:hypothetical protein